MKAFSHREPDLRARLRVLPAFAPAMAGGLLGALLALSGCSSVRVYRGFPLGENGVYLGGVPALRQDARYACGPACLAAVAAYWGVSLDAFRAKCPDFPREASGAELQTLAAGLGLQAFVFRGSEADLRANLQKGRPLIVMLPKPMDPLLPPGGPIGSMLRAAGEQLPHPSHWVVVLGLTGDGDVILHDPDSGPLQMKPAHFLQDWAKKKYECVLVVPRAQANSR